MKKLNFKTTSRHISQLGRELVTDFVTALVELIKNAYDADASAVKIVLDQPNTPNSRIIISDTGCGMTQDDFERKWMVIGTNNKVTDPYTPKGRRKTGKKGIGRFSVERIAEKVTVYSVSSDEAPFKVSINWNKYETIDISQLLQRITVLKNSPDSSAAKYVSGQLDNFFLVKNVTSDDKHEVIKILGGDSFVYTDFYNTRILTVLENDVLPILIKYENTEQLIHDVENELEILNNRTENHPLTHINELYDKNDPTNPKTGLVIIMEGLRDEWSQKDINKLQKELRLLVSPFVHEKYPFKIELSAPGFEIEDIVLSNEILDLCYAKVEGQISDNSQKVSISYTDKKGKKDKVEIKHEQPLLCGDLGVEIYFFLRESAHLSNAEAGFNFLFARKVLDTYCGIKIYRDGFRVKPYGDIGNDWLLLDQRKVRDTHGYLVGNNQVIGMVRIGDDTNPLLVDATNREGIIENEAYLQIVDFLTSCIELISEVRRQAYLDEQDNLQLLESEKEQIDQQFEAFKQRYRRDPVVSSLNEISHRVDDSSRNQIIQLINTYVADSVDKEKKLQSIQNEYNKHYSDTKTAYRKKIEFQESELNLYKNLASLGMLTGSFGHETSDIVSRISASIYLIDSHLKGELMIDDITDVATTISNDFSRVFSYSNLIVNFLRKKKREATVNLNLAEALNEVCRLYSTIVKTYNIDLAVNCKKECYYNMRQIDFESIIINLITNAFEQVKIRELQYRRIIVSVTQSISHVIVAVEDSGLGVPKGKERTIFTPFYTTKDDEIGIGLGLNIVKDIVDSYGGTISVHRSEILSGAEFKVSLPKGDD
ncbi:MAG: ATP-binding protein [Oscillospiraceae bacterium]|nr:ATP-binding protein [Oscillospiraceae bacterium]MCL2278480.1 ATP-binding protein [Oscillospiraceae bacterium]